MGYYRIMQIWLLLLCSHSHNDVPPILSGTFPGRRAFAQYLSSHRPSVPDLAVILSHLISFFLHRIIAVDVVHNFDTTRAQFNHTRGLVGGLACVSIRRRICSEQ